MIWREVTEIFQILENVQIWFLLAELIQLRNQFRYTETKVDTHWLLQLLRHDPQRQY